MNTKDWSPLGLTGWIFLLSKGLSRVFSNTTVQKHQFFGAQPSSQSNWKMTTGKTIALTKQTFVGKVMSLLFNIVRKIQIKCTISLFIKIIVIYFLIKVYLIYNILLVSCINILIQYFIDIQNYHKIFTIFSVLYITSLWLITDSYKITRFACKVFNVL